MRKKKYLAFVGILLLCGGCATAPADEGRTVTGSAEQLKAKEEAEIARIQNDPNLPPQAKAAAIAGLKQGKERAQTLQNTNNPK